MKLVWFAGLILLFAFLAGCSGFAKDAPTPYPTEYLPTMIALTVEANRLAMLTPVPSVDGTAASLNATPTSSLSLEKRTALHTPQPSVVRTDAILPTPSASRTKTTRPSMTITKTLSPTPTSRPTRTPTITPTLEIAIADIQIFSPGPASKVISPLFLDASVRPGDDNRIQVELLGEDGRLLVRKVLRANPSTIRLYLQENLDFETSAVAEVGRLRIITYDQRGRVMAQATQDLILLSLGEADINPPGNLLEMVVVGEPFPNKLIQGGILFVSGMAQVSNDQTMLIELIAADERVVGYRQVFPIDIPQGGYEPFIVDVPYQVESPTWVRLTVKVYSNERLSGLIYLTSLEVLLSP